MDEQNEREHLTRLARAPAFSRLKIAVGDLQDTVPKAPERLLTVSGNRAGGTVRQVCATLPNASRTGQIRVLRILKPRGVGEGE